MIDSTRRDILATGAAATAMAAAPRVLAQNPQQATGSSRNELLRKRSRSHPLRGSRHRLSAAGDRRRRIEFDHRGAIRRQSALQRRWRNSRTSTAASPPTCATPTAASPPVRSRPTGPGIPTPTTISALMDHLGIDKFMVHGFCIGGPFIWNLLKRAPRSRRRRGAGAAVRLAARDARPVLRQQHEGLGRRSLSKRRPDITMEQVEKFLTRMYRTDPDFVFTVTRDFVRQCQTPVLILPDDIPAHPYAVAMESAMLAPNAEVSMFPWKEPKERVPLAVRQIRSFLRAHRPARRRRRSVLQASFGCGVGCGKRSVPTIPAVVADGGHGAMRAFAHLLRFYAPPRPSETPRGRRCGNSGRRTCGPSGGSGPCARAWRHRSHSSSRM